MRIRIGLARPLLVGAFLLALPVDARQIFPAGRRNPAFLRQFRKKGFISLSVVPPHDGSHRRVRFQRRPVDSHDLAFEEAAIG
jgi:hypothetical protein